MAEYNATCAICGKPYEVCRTCKTIELNSWKTVTDTAECFNVFTILHQYNEKQIDKKIAKEKLSKCDLSGLKTYPEHIRKSIEEITKEVSKTPKNMKAVEYSKHK